MRDFLPRVSCEPRGDLLLTMFVAEYPAKLVPFGFSRTAKASVRLTEQHNETRNLDRYKSSTGVWWYSQLNSLSARN